MLVVADASDSMAELRRRLTASLREVRERMDDDGLEVRIVLSKVDRTSKEQRKAAREVVRALGLPEPLLVSSHTGEGMDRLREAIFGHLHGPAVRVFLSGGGTAAVPAMEASVREVALVEDREEQEEGVVLRLRVDVADVERLMAAYPEQITVLRS